MGGIFRAGGDDRCRRLVVARRAGAAFRWRRSPQVKNCRASPMPRFGGNKRRSTSRPASPRGRSRTTSPSLPRLTECVRTYSVNLGLDQITPIAQRHGLKVLQGLWLGRDPEFNRFQIETAVALANRYPDVIRAIVVGNEVLLRGELSAAALTDIIRKVKAAVPVPVTYADVWEFWLRNRDVAISGRFCDHPYPAVLGGRSRYRRATPPTTSSRSRTRSRRVSRARRSWSGSSAGQALAGCARARCRRGSTRRWWRRRCIARAKREGLRVNLIEAYDQPWKRALEGTVGGHWGLMTADTRSAKFAWGKPVSNHPQWLWQALAGILLAGAVFAVVTLLGQPDKLSLAGWVGVLANAIVPGIFVGWAIANIPVESFGVGGWVRSLALLAVVLVAPLAGTVALVRGIAVSPVCPSPWSGGRTAIRVDRFGARNRPCDPDRACNPGRAWPRFRSALSRLSVRAPHGRDDAVRSAGIGRAPRPNHGRACGGDDRRHHACAVRHLHRDQRDHGELAGGVAERCSARPGSYSGSAAGRAKLMIRRPAARPARPAL